MQKVITNYEGRSSVRKIDHKGQKKGSYEKGMREGCCIFRQTPEECSCKNKVNNKVEILKSFKHVTCDSKICRPEETFIGLENPNSCYRFVVTNIGVTNLQTWFCWRLKCPAAMLEGSLNWGLYHCVCGCVSSDFQTTRVYNFHRRSCAKLTGQDVWAAVGTAPRGTK
jgi:hypothetical protein